MEKDLFQNEKWYWLFGLPIAFAFYGIIHFPLSLLSNILFSGIGITNPTAWKIVNLSIHAISIICAMGALWAGWKIVRPSKSKADQKNNEGKN